MQIQIVISNILYKLKQAKSMGIPSELRDMWVANKSKSLMIASPAEEQKVLRTNQCTSGNYYYYFL